MLIADVWHALFGYRLVVPEHVIAYHAEKSGLSPEAMRRAFRQKPPEHQRFYALLTDIDAELDAVLAGKG